MIGDRWGVSQSETVRSYPCDDFVASPTMQAWRGVRVEAPAEAVWPWVAQVRLAPYSYDWIDNRGRRSPRDLAGLPEPAVGDRFTTAGGRELGRIVSVDPGRQLNGPSTTSSRWLPRPTPARAAAAEMGRHLPAAHATTGPACPAASAPAVPKGGRCLCAHLCTAMHNLP